MWDVACARESKVDGSLRGNHTVVIHQVEQSDGLEYLRGDPVLRWEAFDDGVNLVPVAPVALSAQPVAHARPHVVIEVMETVEHAVSGRLPSIVLQAKRLCR